MIPLAERVEGDEFHGCVANHLTHDRAFVIDPLNLAEGESRGRGKGFEGARGLCSSVR